jgi:hypothetical protein
MSKVNPNIDSTGSGSLAQFPPAISLDSLLLSSLISLPPKPLIVYAAFTPTTLDDNTQQLSFVESARRSLVAANGHLPVLESLLSTVHITQQSSTLYVFAISSAETISQSHSNLNNLSFDGLIGKFRPSIFLFNVCLWPRLMHWVAFAILAICVSSRAIIHKTLKVTPMLIEPLSFRT